MRDAQPAAWPLGEPMLIETEERVCARSARIDAIMAEAWHTAVQYLGEDEARRRWVIIGQGKAGRPRRAKHADRDAELLVVYRWRIDQVPPAEIGSIPRDIAERADVARPGYYGSSAGAIERQLRRLIVASDQREAASRAAKARWMKAMWGAGVPPSSILGGPRT